MCVHAKTIHLPVSILQLFISVRVVVFFPCLTVFEASVRYAIRPSGSLSQEESQAAVPTGRIRSEINLPSVKAFMCQRPLELSGYTEQINECGRRVNPQQTDCKSTFQRTRECAGRVHTRPFVCVCVCVLSGRVCRELNPDVMHQESPW